MSSADAPLPAAPIIPGPAPHLLVIRAPYYRGVIEGMSWGACEILRASGATHEILDVAGSFELPQAVALAVRAGQAAHGMHFDGYVALGCIVRGGTDHYDYICRGTIDGLMRVATDNAVALGSGVLTVHSIEQAEARSGRNGFNKGAEAAVAALLQIAALRRFAAGRHVPAPAAGAKSPADATAGA
jgi:6,7-dimethyl-8-ribityllumazine synthase